MVIGDAEGFGSSGSGKGKRVACSSDNLSRADMGSRLATHRNGHIVGATGGPKSSSISPIVGEPVLLTLGKTTDVLREGYRSIVFININEVRGEARCVVSSNRGEKLEYSVVRDPAVALGAPDFGGPVFDAFELEEEFVRMVGLSCRRTRARCPEGQRQA